MPLNASFIAEEDRLDLCFDGNLDLSISTDVCRICNKVAPGLKSCILDLSDVERVFDSGVALLQMLYRRLCALGTTVVILSDRPEVRACVSTIVSRPVHGRGPAVVSQ